MRRLLLALLAPLAACTFTDAGPCDDYCDYICDCHAGEPEYDCEGCRVEYAGGADPELQDECETELGDLQDQDEAEGHVCGAAADTGVGAR